jgi:hypothetical protein
MDKYIIICAAIFAFLIFLKVVEGSPIRSWPAALSMATVLSVLVCLYLNWALPKAAPLASSNQKAERYKAELRRDFSRMAGVASASIEGSTVRIDLASEKPLSEIKSMAQNAAGTTAGFLSEAHAATQVIVQMTVRGQKRYEMTYDPQRGVVEEH